LLVNWAIHALKNAKVTGFWSLEMAGPAIAGRFMLAEGDHNGREVIAARGALPAWQATVKRWREGADGAPALQAGLTLRYSPRATISQWLAEVLTLRDAGGLELALVDYIQLFNHEPDKGEGRHSAIARTMEQLLAAAHTHELPIVIASQMNRAGAGGGSLDTVADSLAIAQYADVFMTLADADEAKPGNGLGPGKKVLEVVKNRLNGGGRGQAWYALHAASGAMRPWEDAPPRAKAPAALPWAGEERGA
jgi:replicative DNA helicase